MKIPLKIKKIGWYLRRGVILTKNNLVKRNWHGRSQCDQTLILPIPLCQIYMVNHSISFQPVPTRIPD
jgi:hypothetical protein